MSKQLCIIHANCQGDSLKQLLLSTPSFSNLFNIQKYTNYLHDKIADSAFENCSIFIYQHLGEHWGEEATDALIKKLPPHTQTLCIPNMFFNGYWPLWTNATHMAYGDLLLEHLAKTGLGMAEILHIFMHGKLSNKFNLQQLVTNSRAKEIIKEKNHHIKTMDIIDAHWQEEQLFYTVNHPAPRLTLHVANAVLDYFGLGKIPQTVEIAFKALEEEFIQPIHPQIGEYFRLPFATNKRLYNVYGQKMNFEQYATAYINCRMQPETEKIDDFVVFLHLLAKKANQVCAA